MVLLFTLWSNSVWWKWSPRAEPIHNHTQTNYVCNLPCSHAVWMFIEIMAMAYIVSRLIILELDTDCWCVSQFFNVPCSSAQFKHDSVSWPTVSCFHNETHCNVAGAAKIMILPVRQNPLSFLHYSVNNQQLTWIRIYLKCDCYMYWFMSWNAGQNHRYRNYRKHRVVSIHGPPNPGFCISISIILMFFPSYHNPVLWALCTTCCIQ